MQPYDSSWDESDDTDAFDRKCEEWAKRDWGSWLRKNLSFPCSRLPWNCDRQRTVGQCRWRTCHGPLVCLRLVATEVKTALLGSFEAALPSLF